MPFNLRYLPRINYYEDGDSNFDRHIFCDVCGDFVFEYCSIHGPLIFIPDDKVPTNSILPACVPRAAITIPSYFLHLAPSNVPGAGIGVFATLTLPRGVRFGPYEGQRIRKGESMYCWQIYDALSRAAHVVDANDDQNSNWMRYVNCARHWHEQNLVAYQYEGQIYYRTIKLIPRFTELMVFYGTEFANLLHVDLRNYNSQCPIIFKRITEPDEKIEKLNLSCKYEENEEKLPEIGTSNVTQIFFDKAVARNDIDHVDVEHEINTKNTEANTSSHIHKPDIFICDECYKMFRSKSSLIVHLKIHTQNNNDLVKLKDIESILVKDSKTGKYHCPICEYSNIKRYKVIGHATTHTGERKFSCETCNKKLVSKSSLKRHLKTHSQEIPHCYKGNNLKSRVSKNNDRKKHLCTICNNILSSMSVLKRHLLTVHYGKQFPCPICAQTLKSQSSMKRHVRLCHTKCE